MIAALDIQEQVVIRNPARRKCSGLTLLETLIALVVSSLILSLAIPSFSDLADRNRLKNAADRMYADLHYARSEAIKGNTRIRVKFKRTDAATWCYGITDQTDCDCTQANSCTVDGKERRVLSSEFETVKLNTPADNTAYIFTPMRGTVSAGAMDFESDQGHQARATINLLGRVGLCSPAGSNNIKDYSQC